MKINSIGLLLIIIVVMFAHGCATPMSGVPSMTLMSREIGRNNSKVQLVGEVVKDSECLNWFFIFGMAGSAMPNHESVVSRMLEKHDADLLIDAEFTTSTVGIPYIFMQMCANVKGQPARLVAGGVK